MHKISFEAVRTFEKIFFYGWYTAYATRLTLPWSGRRDRGTVAGRSGTYSSPYSSHISGNTGYCPGWQLTGEIEIYRFIQDNTWGDYWQERLKSTGLYQILPRVVTDKRG